MPENSILMTEKNEKDTTEVSNKDEIKDLSVKNTKRHPKNTTRWKWKKILIFCLPFLVLIAILIFAPVITIIIGVAFRNINGKYVMLINDSQSFYSKSLQASQFMPQLRNPTSLNLLLSKHQPRL